jgi:hypothetical protein
LTRTATASPRSFRNPVVRYAVLGGLLVCALGLGALGTVAGCNSKSSTLPEGGMTVPCPANSASNSGSAATLTSGKSVENKICYQASSNWYKITVPSGNTLLDVAAGYPSTANSLVQLDVKVLFETSSTQATQLAELIASSQSDGGADSIQTTIHAVNPGTYFIQVADAHNVNFDATNAYKLTVDYAVDPDSHEPNDTTMQAKVSDSKPGWIAYLGDLDIFKTTAANAGDLLTVTLTNPAAASADINYEIQSSSGAVLYQNAAPPSATPLSTTASVPAPGTYYVTLSYAKTSVPTHSPSDGYTLSFSSQTNPDTVPNHTLASAVCPGGGTGPCSMAFTGTDIKLPTQMSYITVPGQRDFYRVDVTSGAALVLQVSLTSAPSTPVKYAIDLLTPDPNSPCMADTDCQAMNLPCSQSLNDSGVAVTNDCELSHECLPPGNYNFCKSKPCSLCTAANLCIPSSKTSTAGFCAVPQYLSAYSIKGLKLGGPTVSTAQPLFTNGTYYINVHDASYSLTDLKNPYSLSLEMIPEPDMNDQTAGAPGSPGAAQRNNFYDPYPSAFSGGAFSDETPNKSRATDITAQLGTGATVTGWISYQTDNDWYQFQSPCPGMNCALDFNWTQPGPTMVHVAFFMLDQDLSVHESFGYDGMPASLSMPFSDTFANQSCSECSFASAEAGTGPYTYYLRVTDVTQKNWDSRNPQGQYTFSVKEGAVGCPAACDQPKGKLMPGCYCYCPDAGGCPPTKF